MNNKLIQKHVETARETRSPTFAQELVAAGGPTPTAYSAAPKRSTRQPWHGVMENAASGFRTIEKETIHLTGEETARAPLVVSREQGRIVRVSGNRIVRGDNRIGHDCMLTGQEAGLEIQGVLTTIGGARVITNNLESSAGDSLLITARMRINDRPPLRKTVTLAGTGGIRITGVIENNLGSGSLTCSGRVSLDNEANLYTGVTTVVLGSTLTVTRLTEGGRPSSIGAASTVPSNLIVSGTLEYRSTVPSETDRLFTANSTIGTALANTSESPSARLAFIGEGEIGLGSSNMPRTLSLAGSNRGDNLFRPTLADNGYAASALHKKGVGKWTVTGRNRHTGGTTIFAGEFVAGSAECLGKGPVIVCDDGVLTVGAPGVPGVFAGAGMLLINGTVRMHSMHASLTLADGSLYIFNGTLDLNGVFDKAPVGEYSVIVGGVGAGRYVDNLRGVAGYHRPKHRASFRQGKVIIAALND